MARITVMSPVSLVSACLGGTLFFAGLPSPSARRLVAVLTLWRLDLFSFENNAVGTLLQISLSFRGMVLCGIYREVSCASWQPVLKQIVFDMKN